MSFKQALFGPRTVTLLGSLLLAGLALRLLAGWFDWSMAAKIGWWLTVPFLILLALLVLVVIPYTWLTSRRR